MTVLRIVLTAFMWTAFGFTIIHFLAIGFWSLLSLRLLGRDRAAARTVPRTSAPLQDDLPGVSIILPAYNEENVIAFSSGNALAQDYGNLEVIVVNDGSKDNTAQVMLETYDMELVEESPQSAPIETEPLYGIYRSRKDERLWFIDKAPSGAKADNANVGINMANHPWVVIMDADEFMETDAITRCMVEIMAAPSDVIAVGTSLLPANDIVIDGSQIVQREASTNYWVGCQLIEYLTAFVISRPGMAHVGALPIISGGFGLYRRETLLTVGGLDRHHIGEDMDLCIRLHRYHLERDLPYRIVQAPEAIIWTEFPNNWKILQRQRMRWHRGLRAIISDNGKYIPRRQYGNFGRFGIGTLYFFEWCGPLIEGAGWIIMVGLLLLGWVDISNAIAMLVATQLVGQVVAVLSVAVAVSTFGFYSRPSDLKRMLWWAVCMNWGFRQMSLYWRLRSILPGDTGWGEMPRAGFKTATST